MEGGEALRLALALPGGALGGRGSLTLRLWSLRRLLWVESRVRGNGGGFSALATHTKGDLPVQSTYIFVLAPATPPHGSSLPALAGVDADRCGGGAGRRVAAQPPG